MSGPIRKIALISLSQIQDESRPSVKAATVRITFRVLCRSIEDLAVCEMLPQRDLAVDEFLLSLQQYVGKIEGGGVLPAVSVMSNDYPLFRKVSALVRLHAPSTPLVAGGAHFVHSFKADRRVVADDSTAAKALKENLADVVCAGQGGVLRKLVEGLGNGAFKFVKTGNRLQLECDAREVPDGMYYRNGAGCIQGRGNGKRPYITSGNPYIIPIRYSDGVGANFNISNRCANRCRYCGSPKHGYDLPIRTYLEELERFVPPNTVRVLQANDNHPFERGNRKRIFELIHALGREHGRPPRLLNFFLDPSILPESDSQDLREFFQTLGGNAHQFQFGRECTSEAVARALGRNYRGKPRDRRRLDLERKAIIELASLLPESTFKVFYIITPFEDEDSVLSTLWEARQLHQYKNITTGSNLLWPLPGSPNRARYKGRYFSFEDLPMEFIDNLEVLAPGDLNFWDCRFPASGLLDVLTASQVKVYVHPRLHNNTLFHLTMMEIVTAIAFGSYEPGTTVSRIVERIPAEVRQEPGDISPDYRDRILEFGKMVDQEQLHRFSEQDRIRIVQLIVENFCMWETTKVQALGEDLKNFFRFRNTFFESNYSITHPADAVEPHCSMESKSERGGRPLR